MAKRIKVTLDKIRFASHTIGSSSKFKVIATATVNGVKKELTITDAPDKIHEILLREHDDMIIGMFKETEKK